MILIKSKKFISKIFFIHLMAASCMIFSCAFGEQDALDALYGTDPVYVLHTTNAIYTSDDLESWTWTGNVLGTHSDSAYGEGNFVIAGLNGSGAFARSDNGHTWFGPIMPNPATAAMWSITYGKGIFIAGTNSGQVCLSDNGESWSTYLTTTGAAFTGISYGNEKFVIVGANTIIYSSDGINWSPDVFTYTANLEDVAYGNGIFVAVGFSAGPNIFVSISSNGNIWSNNIIPVSGLAMLTTVAYGNRKFAIGTDDGDIYTTNDGTNFIRSATLGSAAPITDITYCHREFIAVNASGEIFVSEDGESWESRPSPISGVQINSISCQP